jgi:Leucine-rich repeat (LRR) protein
MIKINIFLLIFILKTLSIHSKYIKHNHIFKYGDKYNDIPLNSFTLYNSINSFTSIPIIEQQALYDLYTFTNGDNWIWKNETISGLKWNFTDLNFYPCGKNGVNPFQGLSCTCTNSSEYFTEYHPYNTNDVSYFYDDDSTLSDIPNGNENISCNINKIYLSGYNLYGSISESISNFEHLTHLHFAQNKISSSLPTTIGNLLQLKVLNLFENLITGVIPYELENLKNLTVLQLQHNSLIGSLPSSLGDIYI